MEYFLEHLRRLAQNNCLDTRKIKLNLKDLKKKMRLLITLILILLGSTLIASSIPIFILAGDLRGFEKQGLCLIIGFCLVLLGIIILILSMVVKSRDEEYSRLKDSQENLVDRIETSISINIPDQDLRP